MKTEMRSAPIFDLAERGVSVIYTAGVWIMTAAVIASCVLWALRASREGGFEEGFLEGTKIIE